MSDPTYRISTTGLYLEPDGTLVPKPKSGAPVVDATEAFAAKLTAGYVGKGLQLMSAGDEAGDGVAEALEELGDAAEGIVLVGDVIELGVEIAEFMGAFPHKKDPVIAKLERIDAHLNSIVVGSYDGEFVRLFVDGREVAAPTPATVGEIGYRLPDGDALYLGAYRGTCEARFDEGKLDEIRLYDQALSAAHIADLYTTER